MFNLSNLIPPQYKIFAIIGAFAVVAIGSGLAGAQVATWKAEAACDESKGELRAEIAKLQKRIDALNEHISKLDNKLAEQNTAVLVAKASADTAKIAQLAAEKKFKAELAESKNRMEKLKAATANETTCDAVLDKYWEQRS